MTHRAPPPPSARRQPVPGAVQRRATPPSLKAAAEQLLAVHGGSFRVRAGEAAPRPPTGTYNFVQLNGATPSSHPVFVSPHLTHAQLAQGKPVVYAGTARFEKGRMEWWSNYSGTYQPIAAFHAQAKLPGEKFVPWQTLQLGGHAMQRPMLGERKAAARPQTAARAPAKPEAKAAAPAAAAKAAGGAKPAGAGGAATKGAASGNTKAPAAAPAKAAQPSGKGGGR
jgi:hypothetical protein